MVNWTQAIKILKSGGVGVIPTDTIYGLVASAWNPKAVERVYELKGRAPDKPCIILIRSLADLKKFGVNPNKTDIKLLKKLWPGPVSVIFPLSPEKSRSFAHLHCGTNTLAFRLPKKSHLRSLLRKTGPLIAPSANPEGKRPAASTTKAKHYFSDKINFYVAGGKLSYKPSTLIAIQAGKIIIVRPGVAKLETI